MSNLPSIKVTSISNLSHISIKLTSVNLPLSNLYLKLISLPNLLSLYIYYINLHNLSLPNLPSCQIYFRRNKKWTKRGKWDTVSRQGRHTEKVMMGQNMFLCKNWKPHLLVIAIWGKKNRPLPMLEARKSLKNVVSCPFRTLHFGTENRPAKWCLSLPAKSRMPNMLICGISVEAIVSLQISVHSFFKPLLLQSANIAAPGIRFREKDQFSIQADLRW